jgi:hypothetical protein
MAIHRSMVVDEAVTPWYHCVSRCVRKAFLCGQGYAHRKDWIEARLEELVGLFAIDCAGFAVMDNHLHVLLRLGSQRVADWPDRDVARRWLTLFPIRDVTGKPLPASEARVGQLAADSAWVAKVRKRLADLGWFMKCLKEPLARMANREEGCTGAFWEGRFRCVAVLDEESLLATAAYIDLNPLAAGIAVTPEDSEHTSLRARIDNCRANGTLETVRDDLSTLTANPAQEADSWLLPLDDLRGQEGGRAGMVEGCTLSCYLRLVDWTSRLVRQEKANLHPAVAPIFVRLGIESSAWEATIARLFRETKRTGSHFGTAARLDEAARAHDRRWHRNQFRRDPRPSSPSSPAA